MAHTTATTTKRTGATEGLDSKDRGWPIAARGAIRRGLVVVAAFAALCLPALTAAAQPCGMEDLGTLGGASSFPSGVSADGSVVVGRATNASGYTRAFRWTAGDGMQDLGALGGYYAEAFGVSADGSVVVGWATDAAGLRRAFRWTAADGMQDLGTLGGIQSEARGVSADGSVVVGRSPIATGYGHAFRWTAGGGMQDLGTLSGRYSEAVGVSADGAVVIGNDVNLVSEYRAFRWTAGGGMQDLGTLGGPVSQVNGLSADGSAVVGAANDAAGEYRAFRWTAAGGMQDLGTLGGAYSSALAASADGAVVVGAAHNPAGNYQAFRWTAAGGMQDFGTLGGALSYSVGVSADGSVVVGRAQNAAGAFRAFRWTAGGGMQDLGTLGGTVAQASGVSADGAVVIGYAHTAAGQSHATIWNAADTDGDGLPDCWEINGIDINGDGVIDLDLAAMGARPDRKDIFVEIDAMAGRAPTMAELQPVIDAFDQAPVPAPPGGGQEGIALHLLIDETSIPLAPFPNNWDDFDAIKAARFGTAAERGDPNWPNIKAAREAAFRYCIFADTYGGSTSSGLAEFPGNDFMVTLGGWDPPGGTSDEKAGTFMHELGHTLQLGHGGGDKTHYKPNYYSVMNYRWQTPHTGYPELWRLDYSREELPPLVESALDESTSLGATRPEYAAVKAPFTTGADTWGWAPLAGGQAVDWNGDGQTPPGQEPVAADINRDEPSDPPGDLTTLTSHDDWANLRYPLTGHANFGDGRTDTTIDDEFDLTEFAINEQIPPPPAQCPADLNGDGIVNTQDFLAYLNLWAAGDPEADWNNDGTVNTIDFLAYLNEWSAGC